MNFKYLKYILAIAEYKNISKAAKALYISQPTLSLYLSNLEKELGIHLFVHGKKEMTLTYAGHLYIEAAQKIMNIKDELYKELDNLASKESKSLSVGIMPLTGSVMFSTVFPEFKQIYPDSSMQISEDISKILEKQVMDGQIKLAVVAADSSVCPDLHYSIIKEEEFVMTISPNHPAFIRLPRDLERVDLSILKDASFILAPSPTIRSRVEAGIFESYGIEPEVMCEISNITAINQMVSNNNGIAFVPKGYIDKTSSNCYFHLTCRPVWNLAVVYKKGYVPNGAEKQFINMVTDYYRTHDSYLPDHTVMLN
ncbi:MAG: LysR family transcriptional regulator [Clostridiaceae bacterium]|nr:LysR family transcriptional regulator [Clostridiaceae bacterium]